MLGRQLLKNGMPEPPPPSLVQSLAASGIHRLVVGHTPHGNCPTVIKSEAASEGGPSLEILMCDTSCSDMRTPDNRGAAVSEVTPPAAPSLAATSLVPFAHPFAFLGRTSAAPRPHLGRTSAAPRPHLGRTSTPLRPGALC